MASVFFERLVSRRVVRFLSDELDLAGMKMGIDQLMAILIVGGMGLFVGVPIVLVLAVHLNSAIAAFGGIGFALIFEVSAYLMLELSIDQRKNFIDSVLPDYLQIVSANVRSGIALDKAMLLAARPEFKYFSDDIKLINKQLYAGETMQNALLLLANKYKSLQLKHTVRMVIEAIQHGGGMSDLLNQIGKDLRNQQMIQKEVSGQLFMYTLFIAFAVLIGTPTLYGLTTQMITVTDTVWAGILKQNPGGLPTTGISFLRPSPPKISIAQYHNFALAAVIIITGFGAFIVSSISTGTIVRGIRYLPIFIIVGLVVFYVVGAAIGGIFGSISSV